jgi:hypothetical protein
MAQPHNTPSAQVDYIACDLPDEMTLQQFRRACCAPPRRGLSLRALGARWFGRQARA